MSPCLYVTINTYQMTRTVYRQLERVTSSAHLCNCKHDNDPHTQHVSHAYSATATPPKAVNMFNTAVTPVISLLLTDQSLRCISGTWITSYFDISPLTPNDPSMGRTAPLTSRRCILYIYSTNIRTEYIKHAAHSSFFSLQNAVYFIMLPFLVGVSFTF